MGGGLMQLVAYGAQDVYLTGNPQITFFKIVYRRHTNFSMESIQQTFDGTAEFGQRVSCTVARNGDLCGRMYLEVTLPSLTTSSGVTSWSEAVGHALVKSVEVEIGGQRIDKQYGHYMEIQDELTCDKNKDLFRSEMIGKQFVESDKGTNDENALVGSLLATSADYRLYVPLQFWFCRNPGLALPLIALQYHEVKVIVEFEQLKNLVRTGANTGSAAAVDSTKFTADKKMSAKLWCDYVYLDTDERRRFAQVSHEYLIEQVQFTGDETVSSGANKLRLNFNHPVKEIMWVIKDSGEVKCNHFGYSATTTNAKLLLNGHDRIAERPGDYFNLVQPWQHHSRMPARNVYCYSFALKPEEHQPSGTCNFSRIDNATLSLTSSAAGTAKVFAVNYNVLRIMSGMGGLAYSN